MRNPFTPKRGRRAKNPVNYVRLEHACIESELAAGIWILFHTPTGLYYTPRALSCVEPVDMAAMYPTREKAEQARENLSVQIAAVLEPITLYDLVKKLTGENLGRPGDDDKPDWGEVGLKDPKT